MTTYFIHKHVKFTWNQGGGEEVGVCDQGEAMARHRRKADTPGPLYIGVICIAIVFRSS